MDLRTYNKFRLPFFEYVFGVDIMIQGGKADKSGKSCLMPLLVGSFVLPWCSAVQAEAVSGEWELSELPAGFNLQYYDDAGVADRQVHFGSAPTFGFAGSSDERARTVAYSNGGRLEARYTGLDSNTDYVLAVRYYSDGERLQRLWCADIELHGDYSLPTDKAVWRYFRIPSKCIASGELTLWFECRFGPNAVVSEVGIYAQLPTRRGPMVKVVGGVMGELYVETFDKVSFEPIADCAVEVMSAEGRRLAAEVTDERGQITFEADAWGTAGRSGQLQVVCRCGEKTFETEIDAARLYIEQPVYRPVDIRNKLCIDGVWRLAYPVCEGFEYADGAARWKPCSVPGQWLQQGFDVPEAEDAVMVREFEVDPSWRGKRVFIRFDAVHGAAMYYLNGRKIGSSERLFLPIEFDITDSVRFGVNRLAVKMHLESESERLSFASKYAHHKLTGIPRSVHVFALPNAHLRKLHIETDLDKTYRDAVLRIRGEVSEVSNVRIKLADGNGTVILDERRHLRSGANAVELAVGNPEKWTSETPVLYNLEITMNADSRQEYTIRRSVGFREVQVVGSEIWINGKAVKLAGVNRHEVDPKSGRADTARWAEVDAKLFKRANVNYVRTSHYPPTREFMEACDRLGLYLEVEAPFCWVRGRGENRVEKAKYFVGATAAMLEYARNHPSVIIWSLGNESGSAGSGPDVMPVNFRKQYEFVKRYDGSRAVCMNNEWAKDGGVCDVAVMHYQPTSAAEKEQTGRPILMDEYWHTVAFVPVHQQVNPGLRDQWGNSSQWQELAAHSRWQGGAIWAAIDEVFELGGDVTTGYGPWGCIADGYRRIKPEFWHVKMHYSPVWLPRIKFEEAAEGSRQIRFEVENRYAFTNLNELYAQWNYLGQSGRLELPSVGPGQNGEVELEIPPVVPGTRLIFLVRNAKQQLIGGWGLQLGKKVIKLRRPAGKVSRWKRDGDMLEIRGTGWMMKFNCVTGLVDAAAGNDCLPLLSLPLPHVTQPEQGFVGTISQTYLELPDMATRRIESVDVQQKAALLVITVKDSFDSMAGTLRWTVGNNGVSEFEYDYSIRSEGLAQVAESGLMFRLPVSYQRLEWEKDSVWGYAPDNHIGRPEGTAEARAGHQAAYLNRPWHLDETEGGTADFRSAKYNVYRAALVDDCGGRFCFRGDGACHNRCCLSGDEVLVRLISGEAVSVDKEEAAAHIRGSFIVSSN